MEKVSRRDFLKIIFITMCYPVLKPFTKAASTPPIYSHGNRQIPAISITFDDCYNYEILKKLEDLLDSYPDIKVTFFPTGIGLANSTLHDADIWNRLLSKGHEIGYHTHSHAVPSSLSMRDTIREFSEWKNTLSRILGSDPIIKFARPPFGDLSWNFFNLCSLENLAIVMWSQNWSLVHETNFLEIRTTQNGDIVLFHIRRQDIENFQACIPKVQEKGLKMVNLTTLLNDQDQSCGATQSKQDNDFCPTPRTATKPCAR